jgi:repressor LexA
VLLGGRPQPLTAKQKAFFDMLSAAIARQGFAPTIEEMAAKRGLSSTGGVHEYLLILERKGWIHRSRGAMRGITILVQP